MSTAQPIRPRMAGKATFHFAIVASQYNLKYVQSMADRASQEIGELEPGAKTLLVWAPGAFELPVLSKLLLNQGKYDAVIALGVVLNGETAHALLVAQSVATALQNLALEFVTPVINEVLLLENEAQAQARCIDSEINRGAEAARAAVTTVRAMRELTARAS